MSLPDGSLLLIILWVFAVFILGNLYRFGETFRKTALVIAMGLVTAASAGGIAFLYFRGQNAGPESRAGLLIFPAVEKSAGVITADGTAVAEIIGEHLRRTPTPPFYIIPTATIFAAADVDSLVDLDYVLRFARAAGLSLIGFCSYEKTAAATDRHVGCSADFKIFDLHQKNTPQETSLHLPERFAGRQEMTFEIARAVLQTFAKNGAVTPGTAWQNQVAPELLQSYYAAQFALLTNRTESALQQARALAQADTSRAQFAGLYVEAFLAHLRGRQMNHTEWNAGLRTILPAAQRAAAGDSLDGANARRLGEIYIRLKKWNEAETALRSAPRCDSTAGEIYLLAAQLHASRWRAFGFQNELEAYRRARALNPLNLAAGLAEADYHRRENRDKQAGEILEQLLRLNPAQADVLMSRARLYMAQNNGPKALEIYERILKAAPDHAEACYNLGIVYYQQRDFDRALNFFERAVKLNDHADARFYLAEIYERRGNLEAAIRYLRERIRLSRGDDDQYAAAARDRLYKILLARGEIPAYLQPDSLK